MYLRYVINKQSYAYSSSFQQILWINKIEICRCSMRQMDLCYVTDVTKMFMSNMDARKIYIEVSWFEGPHTIYLVGDIVKKINMRNSSYNF